MLQQTGGKEASACQSTYIFLLRQCSEDNFFALFYFAAGTQRA